MQKYKHYKRLINFLDERVENDIYPEPPSALHTQITQMMINHLIKFQSINGKKILDCGCGQGLAIEEFTKLGGHVIGTTFGEDYKICKEKGYEVYEMDQSFLEFDNNNFDIIWCRHALEHSIFPMFTLRGFYEVLNKNGLLYVEVPSPDTPARHETNKNHYSCFTKNAWISIFERSNFKIIEIIDIKINLSIGEDHYMSFYLKK